MNCHRLPAYDSSASIKLYRGVFPSSMAILRRPFEQFTILLFTTMAVGNGSETQTLRVKAYRLFNCMASSGDYITHRIEVRAELNDPKEIRYFTFTDYKLNLTYATLHYKILSAFKFLSDNRRHQLRLFWKGES